jgi:hypothetical protein
LLQLSRRYEVEYEEAKRKTKESLHPLKLELAEVNDQVETYSSVYPNRTLIMPSVCRDDIVLRRSTR